MSSIKLTSDGKVLLVDGKPSCACCCPTSTPTFEVDSRSGFKAKVGITEMPGFESSPLKYYLKANGSGYRKWMANATRNITRVDYSGTTEYDRDGYVLSQASYSAKSSTWGGSYASYDCSDPTGTPTTGAGEAGGCFLDALTAADPYPVESGADPCSPTRTEWTICHNDTRYTIDATSEYTTAGMIAYTQSSMPSWPGTWSGTAGSYRNLNGAELNYAERQSKNRIPLSGLGLQNGTVYRAYYVVRFTPVGGGGSTDSAETYLEFTFTTGMTHSPEITVDVPASNGTNTLVGVRWECGPF